MQPLTVDIPRIIRCGVLHWLSLLSVGKSAIMDTNDIEEEDLHGAADFQMAP